MMGSVSPDVLLKLLNLPVGPLTADQLARLYSHTDNASTAPVSSGSTPAAPPQSPRIDPASPGPLGPLGPDAPCALKGVDFSAVHYSAVEATGSTPGSVVITVVLSAAPSVGTVSVSYKTYTCNCGDEPQEQILDGLNDELSPMFDPPATENEDFVHTEDTLTFGIGETQKTFT